MNYYLQNLHKSFLNLRETKNLVSLRLRGNKLSHKMPKFRILFLTKFPERKLETLNLKLKNDTSR